MAKRGYSFSDRFPHLKLFLFLAVLIAFPLTVWSVQKTPTNTQQEAQVASPIPCVLQGGSCYPNNSCPKNYTIISGTCGANVDTACCKLYSKPIGLTATARCDFSHSTIDFDWSNVKDATGYNIYYRESKTSTGLKTAKFLNPPIYKLWNSALSIPEECLAPNCGFANGIWIEWYVRASYQYNQNTMGPSSDHFTIKAATCK